MENCIFCKIINHEIPSYKIYEDEYVLAILDAFPTSYGHVLVLSKKHYSNLLECDQDTLNAITKAVVKIGRALEKSYAKGINILSNINQAAGQTVMHTHIHLIPVNEDGKKAQIEFSSLKDVPLKKIQENIIKNL